MKAAGLSIDGAMVILNEDLLVPELASRRAHEQHRDIVCWVASAPSISTAAWQADTLFRLNASSCGVSVSMVTLRVFPALGGGGVVFHDVK